MNTGGRPVRAILFDFGHTLVDFHRTEEALHEAYERIRERIEAAAYVEVPELLDLIERVAGGVESLVAKSYEERRMEELDITELFRETLAGIGFDLPPDVVGHIVALDHAAWSSSLAVEPEVVEVLRGLRSDGYRMGLVSNMSLSGQAIGSDVERLGLAGFFEGVVFSSGFGVRKPDPRIFQEALRLVGASAEETVFVGDRLLDDVGGAKAVGMRAVLTHQFRQEEPGADDHPDAVVEHLGELPATLGRWGAPIGEHSTSDGSPRDPSRPGPETVPPTPREAQRFIDETPELGARRSTPGASGGVSRPSSGRPTPTAPAR